MSWAEAKWTVDSLLQKIGTPPNNMRLFTATTLTPTSVGLNFLEPEDSVIEGNIICSVYGVMIRMSTEGYPTSPTEGTLVIDNRDLGKYETEMFIIEGLKEETDYYFTAFPYAHNGVYNTYNSKLNRADATPGVRVFGIQRRLASTSSSWTRTDAAVGLTARASVGTTAGSSDFDNLMPWAGIKRETLSTGDVMVKIPKFYYQRYRDEDDVEYIKIADGKKVGFKLHPVFNRGGVERDSVYVAAYKTTWGNKSVAGDTPQTGSVASVRSGVTAKGTGWGLIDMAAYSAIQMLILVEYATNNVQTMIGNGYTTSNNKALAVGTCDNVPNLTGTPTSSAQPDVVWRGIEGFWGNVWEIVDGVWFDNGHYRLTNDPSLYSEYDDDDYMTILNYTGTKGWESAYIEQVGLDIACDYVMLPEIAGSASSSSYYCDTARTGSDSKYYILLHGGSWDSSSQAGLFAVRFDRADTDTSAWQGSRMMYIPS